MAELAIEVTGLVVRRARSLVLGGVGIRVERGSVYGLAGPRGSGKTSVLRVLAGLSPAAAGEVTVLGRTVPDRRLRSRVGYVPEEVGLYGDLTVLEHLALFAELQGLAESDIEVRQAELLELLGLVECRTTRVSRLPGTLRRKVSIAVALIHHPELLALDEPMSSGDPELRSAFWAVAARLRSGGATTLLATRDLWDAARCDRVGLLRDGTLLAEGAPEEILRKTGSTTLDEAFLALARKAEG